ncbi:MAG TPA: DUF898 family protein [Hypericibacter adhaerens]|uniref:YjgN family protein n=1 Tax=Hypericibacter adhaerens TaxID=2602016 RepID=UPI002CBBC9C9|nr:DUF898 family protein [Hypericibacter adhaerens]HWA41697.1 DUF898 family protein [Hypericibacter adhaerens]
MAAITTAGEPALPGAGTQRLVYDGGLMGLYEIYLLNLVLTVITIGIFRFWAKTRIRRYVWSHVSFQGDRLEYTGTGGELFKGFLIVLGFIVLYGILQSVLQFALGPTSVIAVVVQFAFMFFVVYLALVAHYTAQNYRLTRTLWRGVRGGMTGSGWSYGIKALLLSLLLPLSLGLAQPWVTSKLVNWRANASWFGSERLQLDLRAGPLYGAFILSVVLTLALAALFMGAIGGFAYLRGWLDLDGFMDYVQQHQMEGGVPDDAQARTIVQLVFVAYATILLGFGLAYILGWAFYAATFYRVTAGSAQFANLRFQSHATAGRLIGLWAGNAVIYVVTLGFGYPILIQRTLRFIERNLEIQGELDGTRLTQSTIARPRFGEGLLEAFDPGMF